MTARLVNSAQVRALAEQVRAASPGSRAMIVRARPVWDGPAELALSNGVARVVSAVSPLAVREALTRRDGESLLVVLTEVPDRELGSDVLARVAKARVIVPLAWDLVRARLSLSQLEPKLGAQPWMAEALLQYEPPEGWTPPVGALLSLDLAWSMLCEHWLKLTPDGRLASLFEWMARAGAVDAVLKAPEMVRDGVLAELRARHGAAGVLALNVAATGRPGDVVPLGLAARAAFAYAEADLTSARVHFAVNVGEKSVDRSIAEVWADAAESVVRDRLASESRAAIDPWLVRAEQLVVSFTAEGGVRSSAVLPSGLEQRYSYAAGLALAASKGDEVAFASLDNATVSVQEHLLAALDPDRVLALEAAARLARRATVSREPADVFTQAGEFHRRDSSWCDRARRLVRYGDGNPQVSAVYTELLAAVDTERESENRRFADLLMQWSASEPMPAVGRVPIENVLAEVVAPLAQSTPVMLVVMDGMSWSVATELLASLDAQGWLAVQPEGAAVPNAVAVLPTVTNISRASLLCGTRTVCDAAGEKQDFAKVPALNGMKPVLFHKGDLSTADGQALGAAVQAALADPSRRVVGVVVNAVDDHLGRGDQVRVKWSLDTVAPLRDLLSTATANGRAVVLTSDHGHVLDEKGRTQYRQVQGATERWRPSTPPPAEGELVVRGPRVLAGDGEIIVPWTETIRYGTPKHGYHGGITPQEVMVPLLVLSRATAVPAGWERADEEPPAWWRLGAPNVVRPLPVMAPVAPVVAPPAATPAKPGQPGLFDETPPVVAVAASVAPTWIDALLQSPAYLARTAQIARVQVDNATVTRVLTALDSAGGSLLRETLAVEIGVPLFRVDGLVQSLRRLLNVDGYSVIDLDNDTVRLHRELLRTQFEVGG